MILAEIHDFKLKSISTECIWSLMEGTRSIKTSTNDFHKLSLGRQYIIFNWKQTIITFNFIISDNQVLATMSYDWFYCEKSVKLVFLNLCYFKIV